MDVPHHSGRPEDVGNHQVVVVLKPRTLLMNLILDLSSGRIRKPRKSISQRWIKDTFLILSPTISSHPLPGVGCPRSTSDGTVIRASLVNLVRHAWCKRIG